jgi:hypothetical protein
VRYGEEIDKGKGKEKTEIRGSGIQPLPDLRKASRLYAQVRYVQALFSQYGFVR